MKILFFLALLANLTFFFWHYNEGGYAFLARQAVATTDSEPKQIQLLAELKPNALAQLTVKSTQPVITKNLLDHDNTTIAVNTPLTNHELGATADVEKNTAHPVFKQPEEKTSPPESAARKTYCYFVSGFANKTAIESWLNNQPATTELGRKIKKNKIVGFDYQVYYPAAANLAQSQRNLTIVKNAGVQEVFLIRNKQFAGDMSFGIFSEQARAIAVQQSLSARGIRTLIRKRPKINAVIYVRIKTEKNKQQLIASLKAHTHKLAVESARRCH
jgi:hypothetical protein